MMGDNRFTSRPKQKIIRSRLVLLGLISSLLIGLSFMPEMTGGITHAQAPIVWATPVIISDADRFDWFADITVDLTNSPGIGMEYLMFDWDGEDQPEGSPDGYIYDDNPTGRATFGIISRPKQVIYTREPWN